MMSEGYNNKNKYLWKKEESVFSTFIALKEKRH